MARSWHDGAQDNEYEKNKGKYRQRIIEEGYKWRQKKDGTSKPNHENRESMECEGDGWQETDTTGLKVMNMNRKREC